MILSNSFLSLQHHNDLMKSNIINLEEMKIIYPIHLSLISIEIRLLTEMPFSIFTRIQISIFTSCITIFNLLLYRGLWFLNLSMFRSSKLDKMNWYHCPLDGFLSKTIIMFSIECNCCNHIEFYERNITQTEQWNYNVESTRDCAKF